MRKARIIGAAAASLALALVLPVAVRPVAPTWSAFSQTTANGPSSLAAASSFYKALILANGPVGYWRLGETSGSTAVDVMAASNGTYAGGVFVSSTDKALVNDTNGAIDFNGTSGRISIPHVAAFVLTNAASFEVWVKPDSLGSTSERWILNKGTAATPTFYLAISGGYAVAGFESTTVGIVQIMTSTVPAGSWQHFVMTFNGTTFILYRNGVSVASAAAGGNIVATTAALSLGSKDATVGWYDGRLDEVALYNKVLTPAQVLADYQRGALTRP
jgi:hypothetical protein